MNLSVYIEKLTPYFNMMNKVVFSSEIKYALLIFALFIIPRFLIRYNIPAALTAFFAGMLFLFFDSNLVNDQVVSMMSSLGIITLFLFAGLEIDFSEFRENKKYLFQHIFSKIIMLIACVYVFIYFLKLEIRPASILALAILTPSTGFILDSLSQAKISESSKFWIKSKAIAAEIVALTAMFILVQSVTVTRLSISLLAMFLLILIIPLTFKLFHRIIAPYAPKSEFGFLVIIAILSGFFTKKLGAYYLIGAFVVGIIARRYENLMPSLTTKTVIKSLKLFSSFFMPFYFFKSGMHISINDFSTNALVFGIILLMVFVPFRLYTVVFHRRFFLKEEKHESYSVAACLLPNLVFGLVLANILSELFHVPRFVFGGLIIYTIGVSAISPIVLKIFGESPEYFALYEKENNYSEIV